MKSRINQEILMEIGKRKAYLFEKIKNQLDSRKEYQSLKDSEKKEILNMFKNKIGELDPILLLTEDEKTSKRINQHEKLEELKIETDKILLSLLKGI